MHSTARRLSSPLTTNLNLEPENSEIFEFKQLLDTIQFSSLPQKDTKSGITKKKYFFFLLNHQFKYSNFTKKIPRFYFS